MAFADNGTIRQLAVFFGLILGTIVINYFTSEMIANVFFMIILAVYFRSKAEVFWLAYFLVLSDGFMGFFDAFDAVLSVLPGLPAIEVSQLYILLTVVKAVRKKTDYQPFFQPMLILLFVFVIFLIIQGQIMGLSSALNIQFRVLKLITPLALFYSLPRLLDREEDCVEFFRYVFPLVFTILFSQLFTMVFAETPAQFAGVQKETWFAYEVTSEQIYRGFYNPATLVISLFGALFYLSMRSSFFSSSFLMAVVLANFFSIFLSATRGWIISFSLILGLYVIFVAKINLRRGLTVAFTSVIFLAVVFVVPKVQIQIQNTVERLMTLKALAKGDLSAGGTLVRLTERGPRVLRYWSESPLTGWGFSDLFLNNGDTHVANQTILLHGGIVGIFLLFLFFAIFLGKIILRSLELPAGHPLKKALLVIPILFIGWYLVHSTSGQHFSFHPQARWGIVQAFFFNFGALYYALTFKKDANPTNSID